jgi:hypothetical protein
MHLRDYSGSDDGRLASLLPSLTRYTTLPAVDRLTLSSWQSSTGPAGSECGPYGATYGLDSASRVLSWDECLADSQGVYRLRRGSRTVTENERTLVLVTLALLAPGTSSSGSCPTTPPFSLLVEAAGATTRYVSDSWAACDPLPEGTFIRNLYEMTILQTLARKT